MYIYSEGGEVMTPEDVKIIIEHLGKLVNACVGIGFTLVIIAFIQAFKD